MLKRNPHTIPLLGVVTAALLVQSVSFSSYFRHDDWVHFYGAIDPGLGQYTMRPYGGHLFPVVKVIFGLSNQVFGLNTLPFVILQFFTHCLNVALIYGLIYRVTSQRFSACFAAVLWGTAPIHVFTIGWFSCLQILMCLTCLLGIFYDLAGYVRAGRAPGAKSIICWYLLAGLGMCSWGAGNVISLSLPTIAFLVLPKDANRLRTALCLMPLMIVPFAYQAYISSFGVPVSVTSISPAKVIHLGAMLVSYGYAAFSCAPMFTISEAGTPIWTGHGPSPPAFIALTLLVSIPCLAITVVGYFRGSPQTRRWMLGIALLLFGSYGLIAIGRSVVSLRSVYELATTDRYHYLSGACIVLILATALSALSIRLPNWYPQTSRALRMGLLLLIVATGLWGAIRTRLARRDAAMHQHVVYYEHRLRRIVASAPPGNDVYIHNGRFAPLSLLMALGIKIDSFPNLAGYYAITRKTNTLEGRRIYFVESDIEYLQRVRLRTDCRMSQLLVSPVEVPVAQVAVLANERKRR